jgi:hypothetical protein
MSKRFRFSSPVRFRFVIVRGKYTCIYILITHTGPCHHENQTRFSESPRYKAIFQDGNKLVSQVTRSYEISSMFLEQDRRPGLVRFLPMFLQHMLLISLFGGEYSITIRVRALKHRSLGIMHSSDVHRQLKRQTELYRTIGADVKTFLRRQSVYSESMSTKIRAFSK